MKETRVWISRATSIKVPDEYAGKVKQMLISRKIPFDMRAGSTIFDLLDKDPSETSTAMLMLLAQRNIPAKAIIHHWA